MYESTIPAKGNTLGRLVSVLLVCVFSFFVHLGAPEVSLMEARNFVAAREMAAGGSWLIPTLNRELRLAKPPLPTWAVAAEEVLFGATDNLALLRLPAALMATLLVLFFWGLASELTRDAPADAIDPGRTAWLSALVLASSLLVIVSGREGQWDIFAYSFLVGSLWLLVRGWRSDSQTYGSFVGAGLLLGFSILSKGPVALYGALVPFMGCYISTLNTDARRKGVRGHWRGTLLAAIVGLAVGGSWPLYILYHVRPAALAVAQTEVAAWGERHVQPLWYYWSFFVFTGVWVVATVASLVVPYARRRLGGFLPYLLVLGWLLASLVLLSLVPEKKVRYMLPLLPPLALLTAGALRYWETAFRSQQASLTDRLLLRFWAAVLALVCVVVPAAMVVIHLPGFGPTSLQFGAVILIVAALGIAVVRAGWYVLAPRVLMGASITLMAALLTILEPAYPVWEGRNAELGVRQLSAARQQPAIQHIPWYSLDHMQVKQVWAAGHAVPTWNPATDSLPLQQLPIAVFSDSLPDAKIPARWRRHLQIQVVDGYYLGRERKKGHWFISILRPL
ncbi:glycosyltransferase family 39 protein [Hymenobacter sp. BT188]|uniref:ArnT family glycosyltransferase n=1 Tax=Hymenobacter sp. BT188 TaxID=2763504 RepID=UPI0016518F5F|nr:glycosyltransferase family 39 protein [Hymenobacter sp. BT188]MBC6608988.1 glycosyltransferase family 39 protein [Hymenobacter sp. BT188]